MWPSIESPDPQIDYKPAAVVTPRLRCRKRPKSACSVRPCRPRPAPRPFSALGLRRHDHHYEFRVCSRLDINEEFSGTSRREPTPVSQYQRCLKLLGLIPSEDSNRCNRLHIKNVKPKVQTFVVRRTVSQDDVRDAVLKDIERSTSDADCSERFPDHIASRRILAKAVYEEWYFNKMEAAKKHRKQQFLQKRTEQWHQTRMKRERREKSQEKFKEWIVRKNEQIKKERGLQIKLREAEERKKDAEASFNAWKEQKDKLIKNMIREENRLKCLEKEQKIRVEDRRTEAEKAFQSWRKSVDNTLKMKQRDLEKKRNEEDENRVREEAEKKQNANAAFKCWKKNKDTELQREMKELREKEAAATTARRELFIQRQLSAQQAFLRWLDSLYY